MPNKNTKKSYRRGGKKHYADLARASVDSRIKRHISAEVVLDERAIALPSRKRDSDAGYDIATPHAIDLPPGKRCHVETGVRICCPRGYFFMPFGRSSLTAKGIEVVSNVIDATYTGEIRLTLINRSDDTVRFRAGDRIAQLLFLPQIHVAFKQVSAFKHDAEARGDAGFGSTGLSSSQN